jgi:threonine aldolase
MLQQKKICLASDNWAPAHPSILQAVVDANESYVPSYGSDVWTEEAQKTIQNAFNSNCKVFIIPTGTGANIFGLRLACRRFESIICTDIAHINYQESGAAEALIGCKLLTIPHENGKITPNLILKKLKLERAFGKHSTSPRVLSITQPTEVGTVYSLEELRALSALCQEENLLLHMDGSRLYNAAIHLNVTLSDIVKAAQLDILSLGGTKNGLLGAEALLIFNESLQAGSDHLQKQTLQLLSKMRYVSTQYIPFFQKDLWKTLATQANQQAYKIATAIKAIPHLALSYPVETNQIFFTAPASWLPLIQEEIFCYPWNPEKNELRFITSWNTSDQEVKAVASILSKISCNSR